MTGGVDRVICEQCKEGPCSNSTQVAANLYKEDGRKGKLKSVSRMRRCWGMKEEFGARGN